jgi:uncharacterized damage-inducible protein DinB
MAKQEVWLRGPVEGIPPLLQPVAHALLQCREELEAHLSGLAPEHIWVRPGGAASIGYHARHAAGSLDRLFTYARGAQLSDAQRAVLAREKEPDPGLAAEDLLATFGAAVESALDQLRTTDERTLTEARFVGRAQLPSTVIGLLFHAAEHTQRHAGQIATTVRMLVEGR